MSTLHVQTLPNRFPVCIPNTVLPGDGFYVSYNSHDTAIYEDVTTALVQGQMEHFYILNGDHRAAYLPLMSEGFAACLAYFQAHPDEKAKHSE